MCKRDFIDRIMDLNHSARREFLQAFSENELADYLRQLESVTCLPAMATAVDASNNSATISVVS